MPACSLLAPGDDNLLADRKRDASTDAPGYGSGGSPGDAQGGRACAEWQECAAGEYCVRGHCAPCTDLGPGTDATEIAFDVAQSLSGVNANVGVHALRYPRAFALGTPLIYTREYFGGQIWLSEDFDQSTGAPLASPFSSPGVKESAPLKIAWTVTGALAGLNFFFDREQNVDGGPARHDLYGASISANGTATNVVRLPAPFNAALPTPRWSYGLAVSRSHAFWMVNNDGYLDLHLLSMKLDGQGIPTDIALEVPPGCTNREFDYAVWAAPDAPFLFFTAKERDASCEVLENESFDLFVVKLTDAGLPAGAAVPIRGASLPGRNDMDPSLSPDACWLYFASDRDSPGKARLFRAHRVDAADGSAP